MKKLAKFTILASSVLIGLGTANAYADSAVTLETGSSIQSNTVVPGATPEKLMDKDAAMNDTGFELGTDIEPEAGTADANVNLSTENDVMFDDIDTDNDGMINLEQFSASIDADTSAESFSEFDIDDDGLMSESEYQAYLEADLQTDLAE